MTAPAVFERQGYAATTMKAIAAEAGMAVQSVYFTFASKRALLAELLDREIAGDTEPVATMDRPWFREALAADAPEQVRRQVAGTGEILRRVAGCSTWSAPPPRPTPNWSSCGGPTWRSGHAVRLRLAEALAEKAALRPDLTPARAADVCLATLTPETYLLLVDDRAWSHEQWEHWATDTLTRQLLTRPPSA